MKRNISIIVVLIAVMVSFLIGKNIDNFFGADTNMTKQLVGVYESDSWNGKQAYLILYDDGTCQYPSGGGISWSLNNNLVEITVKHMVYDNGTQTLTVHFDRGLSDDEAKTITRNITNLKNIESVDYLSDEHQRRLYIKLITEDENKETYNTIVSMQGVYSVEYEYREIEEYTKYEAKIMEKGLLLHGKFFEKVSG